jgi:hypothetical protein
MTDAARSASIKVNAACPGWVITSIDGSIAPISSQSAALDIAHFAMLNES